MHFHCEVDEDKEYGVRMVRAHRTWYGKPPKELEKVEIPDYVSDEPTIFCIQLAPDEAVEGKSARMTTADLVITAEPEVYGDPVAREAAGKGTAVRLKFEEWIYIPTV